MKGAPRVTLLGVLLLLLLVVGAAVLALALVAAFDDPWIDLTATWRQTNGDLTLEVSERDGAYLVSFRQDDAGWRRSAEATRVDRFQLAGRLGEIQGPPPPRDPPVVAQAETGAPVSIVAVNDDTVSASVRDDGAASWTDVGSFERAHIWSDPYRAAGLTILYLLGAMTIALVLWIPIAGDRLAARERQPGRLLLRVVTVIGAAVLLVAFVTGVPTLAFLAVVLPFAFLLFYLVKWLPDEITSTGQLLDYIFSPKRREPFLRDQAARDAQALRGAALEKTLDEVKDERSGRAD